MQSAGSSGRNRGAAGAVETDAIESSRLSGRKRRAAAEVDGKREAAVEADRCNRAGSGS